MVWTRRQHRDRERRALESAEAGTIQQSPLPSLEQPWVQEFPAAIEEVYAMPDIGPDDDAQETQRLLQHQHREKQRRALEGAEDKDVEVEGAEVIVVEVESCMAVEDTDDVQCSVDADGTEMEGSEVTVEDSETAVEVGVVRG